MRESPATRPAPAASGTLAKTPLVHLLIYVLEKKLAGTIEVSAPDRQPALLLFVGGEPAKVRSNNPALCLGRVLLDLGHMTEPELTRSLAQQASQADRPVLYGEMLVASGVLDPAQLEAALREQLARALRYIASMPGETTYAFYSGYDGLRGWGTDAPRGVDPLTMLWRMLREATPRAHVDAGLARVAASPLRLVRAPELDRLGIGATERAAVEATRAHPALAVDLARATGLTEGDARLLVYLLLITKQVDVLAPGQASRVEARAVTPPPATPVPPAGSSPPARLSPPGGSSRTTGSPPPVRSSSPVPADRSGARPAVLSDPPPPPRPPSRPPPGLSSELAQRWAEIVDRAARIDSNDYFAILDISRDAPTADVQTAFLALAKRWHPDRLPNDLSPIRDVCSRVFARMNEAHATLADEERRKRYMRLLADGSGSPEMQEQVAKIVEAASRFQKAEVCFKRQDYEQAESLCRKALKADPTQPDYHAMHTWLLSLKPENQAPEKVVELVQALDAAIALSDRCERAFFWRGMLNKRLGKVALAQRDFKRAIELNPRNIDAAREVRLHQMRGGAHAEERRPSPLPGRPSKADESGKQGLLGRLFKK